MLNKFIFILLFFANIIYAAQHGFGEKLYKVYCVQCHGIEGDGYGINSIDMEVLPKDHTDVEEMITRTDEDIFKSIKFGGKAVSKSILMPNWDANLTDEQINDLVIHVKHLCCEEQGDNK